MNEILFTIFHCLVLVFKFSLHLVRNSVILRKSEPSRVSRFYFIFSFRRTNQDSNRSFIHSFNEFDNFWCLSRDMSTHFAPTYECIDNETSRLSRPKATSWNGTGDTTIRLRLIILCVKTIIWMLIKFSFFYLVLQSPLPLEPPRRFIELPRDSLYIINTRPRVHRILLCHKICVYNMWAPHERLKNLLINYLILRLSL
jgi:hypothetical protein